MNGGNEITRRLAIKGIGMASAAVALSSARLADGQTDAQANGKKIGVALVGGAHIHTPEYINALKSHGNINAKYVWDHDAGRAAKRANELGSRSITDLKHIWDDPEIAAVVICSETNRHHDLVLAAAHAKKHMFVEKPLGITARESFAMAEAIEKADLIFTTGYFMRCQREYIFLKDQVAKGSFGKITRVRGSNCHNGSLGGWFDGEYRWMAEPKISGVGAFGDLGTHSLDILMWILGGIGSVTADIRQVTSRYPDCDETGEALIRFENDVIGTLAAGWVDIDNPVTFLISGTEGHAVIFNGQLFFHSNRVGHADGKEPWGDLPKGSPPPIEQFFTAIEGGSRTLLVTPSEAAARVAVMEAAYQGARSESWVKVAQA